MKKPIALLSVLLALSLLFTACGESSSPTVNYGDSAANASTMPATTESVTEPENTIPLTITLDSEGYVPLNEDGIVELKSYSNTTSVDNPCYTDRSDWNVQEKHYIVLWKHADEPIPKIKKDSTIGIYDAKESVTLLPIDDTTAQYTVPLNFFDDLANYPDSENVENVASHPGVYLPDYFPETKLRDTYGWYRLNGLAECNGQDLTEYVNNHSHVFYRNSGSTSVVKLLKAQKNEEFTFGGYYGTEWEEFTVRAYWEYINVCQKPEGGYGAITLPVEKTKNGYFQIDFSGLESGVYYVDTYSSFIEIV